jgi:hypothetical protein
MSAPPTLLRASDGHSLSQWCSGNRSWLGGSHGARSNHGELDRIRRTRGSAPALLGSVVWSQAVVIVGRCDELDPCLPCLRLSSLSCMRPRDDSMALSAGSPDGSQRSRETGVVELVAEGPRGNRADSTGLRDGLWWRECRCSLTASEGVLHSRLHASSGHEHRAPHKSPSRHGRTFSFLGSAEAVLGQTNPREECPAN